MTMFFISDTHFGHSKMIDEWKYRPFASVTDMNEALVKNWNDAVGPEDTVWHLGDVCLETQSEDDFKILGRLNGKKKLVLGNHDSPKKIEHYKNYFEKIVAYEELYSKELGGTIFLSHVPIHESQFPRFVLNIHGHMHKETVADNRYASVCVEQIDYTPISYGTLISVQKHLEKIERQEKTYECGACGRLYINPNK